MQTHRRLEKLRRHWDELAAFDPVGSVLASFQRAGVIADQKFFLQGEHEIEFILDFCTRLGAAPPLGNALDIGCGIGRVTRALALRFDEAVGVDISSEMLRQARASQAHLSNVALMQNGATLSMFQDSSFDFVYSSRVLQHIPDPDQVRIYLEEFVRVLTLPGILVFQLPSSIPMKNRLQSRTRLYSVLRSVGLPANLLLQGLRLTPMRMAAVAQEEVEKTIQNAGGDLLHVEQFEGGSTLYFVRKALAC
jgi:ubiquinone/menaquinone biosynthesis C-methylase UbiE